MPFVAADFSLFMESSEAQNLPGAQWETLPNKWKRAVRDNLMCLLILFHFIIFILKTSEIHDIQLSNSLSFSQGKPVATPASYLKRTWERSAVLTGSLLCRVLVACKLNLLWQMMVTPISERLVLYWENRVGCMEVTWPGKGK